MWPFHRHHLSGHTSYPTNHHLQVIEKVMARMGLQKGSDWLPSLDHITLNALFQRSGDGSVYRIEAFTDSGGTHCRVVREMGYLVLDPAGTMASCTVKDLDARSIEHGPAARAPGESPLPPQASQMPQSHPAPGTHAP